MRRVDAERGPPPPINDSPLKGTTIMKKFAVIAVLAVLAATGLSHKAMAWCKFNFSCGCNICFEKGGDSCCTMSFCKTHHDGCGPGGCGGGVTYGYPSDLAGRVQAE